MSNGAPDAGDRRWLAAVVLIVVTVTFLPYLFDWSLQDASPLHGWYSWYAFNVTDSCVYLSWMRQYADGAWLHRNLFTTVPQAGHQINLFFLLLGKLGAWTGAPLIVLYHVARALAACAVLVLTWRLCTLLGFMGRARRLALLTVAFGAGLGWVPGLWEREFAGPVDIWQPEAVTFLSIYLFPLFAISQALMLGVLINLLEAERRRSTRHALFAGLCAFVLGNIHTYDIITLSLVWIAYLAVVAIQNARGTSCEDVRFDRGMAARLLAAGLPAAISTLHMLWVYRTEAVFAQRVAVPTMSAAPIQVLMGFGLLLPLGVGGVVWTGRIARRGQGTVPGGLTFLVVWACANVLAAYLPVSFQRKMLMGAHLPIAMLAGLGLTSIASQVNQGLQRPLIGATLCLLALTNVRFVLRDRGNLRHGGETVRAFMLSGERSALEWLRRHADPGAVVQPLPWLAVGPDGRKGFVDTTVACFTPGLTGHPVDAGHWGETPDFGHAMGKWLRFLLPDVPDQWRRELLRTTGVRYIVFSQIRPETRDAVADSVLQTSAVPDGLPYLRRLPEASGPDAAVYEVLNP